MPMPQQEGAAPDPPANVPTALPRSEALQAELGALEAMLPAEPAPPEAAPDPVAGGAGAGAN